ncbi:hypothetical protein ACP275_12G062400 [Erythranthe tilingii]
MKGVAVVLVVVSLAATPGEAVSCGELQSSLAPCLSYLTGGGEPSESCCGGLRSASGTEQCISTQDRQTVCYCMKSAASTYNVPTDAAATLPGKCGVSVGMTLAPTLTAASTIS